MMLAHMGINNTLMGCEIQHVSKECTSWKHYPFNARSYSNTFTEYTQEQKLFLLHLYTIIWKVSVGCLLFIYSLLFNCLLLLHHYTSGGSTSWG